MRIGSLAHSAGVTTKTVRFYEQAGLLPEPPRTPSGYRDYPPESADRLMFIRGAQVAGLTLAEIRHILAVRDSDRAPSGPDADLVAGLLRQVESRLAELAHARDTLRALAAPPPGRPARAGDAARPDAAGDRPDRPGPTGA
ncbi:heavy metal-responsive transcriptional regulator [Streptomyces marincola]|uniref:heavy metal-responsive transcriptional regulator n=1 Tax=Streptomyces marincola TaxID=2878388 RepID=UPI001CF3683C|nr:heavy metal-responsive transcriptional regulator [Streptomyces marincola]UCM88227.1 heavy metal-responsive transcriptional regulator [Streptomyces marincola]